MGFRKFATQGVLGGKKTIKYGNFTATWGLKLYPPLLKYIDPAALLRLKQYNMDLTVSYSPFGPVDEGGRAFLKGAPVTKGRTIEELEKLPVGKKIVDGLRRAAEISKKHTEKGVAIVVTPWGAIRMPMKAAMMMREGKRGGMIRAISTRVGRVVPAPIIAPPPE